MVDLARNDPEIIVAFGIYIYIYIYVDLKTLCKKGVDFNIDIFNYFKINF